MVPANHPTKKIYACRMLPILAFLLSLGVYLGGLCFLIQNWPVDLEHHQQQKEQDSGNNESNIYTGTLEKSFLLIPVYASLFVGPVLLLVGTLFLCRAERDSFAGPILTILGVANSIYEGHIAYTIGQTILINAKPDIPYTAHVCLGFSMILTGVVGQAVSWVAVMTISHSIQRVPAKRDKHDESGLNHKEKKTLSPDLERKLVVAFTLLSAVTWLLLASRINFNDHNEMYVLGAFFVGPILFLFALLHTGCSEWMRVPTYTLSMLYVMLVGAGMLKYCYTYKSGIYYRVMLAGSIVNLIFWTAALIFGHFYHDDAHPPHLQDRVQQGAGERCGTGGEKKQEVGNCREPLEAKT